MRAPGSFQLLTETNTQKKIGDYSKMRATPTGDDETPEIGSVECSRGLDHR